MNALDRGSSALLRAAAQRRRLSRVLSLAAGTAALAAPGLALAANHEVCVRWRVQPMELLSGTRGATKQTLWNARGVRIQLLKTGQATQEQIASNSTGCANFNLSSAWNTGYHVRVFFDTRVGHPASGSTGRVRTKGYFIKSEADNDASLFMQFANVVPTPVGSNFAVTVQSAAGVHPMQNSLASVSHTLHQVDINVGDSAYRPTSPPMLKMILRGCQDNNDASAGSCYDPSTVRMWLNGSNGSQEQKFVSAHETGHHIDGYWGKTSGGFVGMSAGASGAYGFGDQPSLAQPCRWSGQGQHAMRSQEYQRAAVLEGFAHFIALNAFNLPNSTDDPEFRYYKTYDPADANNGLYPANEVYLGATATPYPFDYIRAASGCNCTALSNCTGTSTQMQWMRAYWLYLIRNEPTPTTKPTLSEFFRHARAVPKSVDPVRCGNSTDRCHGAMINAANAIADSLSGSEKTKWQNLASRWSNVGVTFGLNTD